ncbi:SDR family NAD(P)-dependent oxidoreductase [Actinacidiphila bryophytorum]|uniref:SDR family NAD(P)-dependent oxidoreductase n=1 Tax=Actinacidiphila bryophytorum TaxID=1436133 RepID=UPI002176ADAA|nr:SDR family NAD(P)-dependent oxidoreductase [Actinacidiphila bryophytorum]UWE10398.1 SDR family NAD(P)-dependent oxidoreductase [Actinacidiphila bryophytorum]
MATIADRAVLITGSNRGIGRALVAEALRRGAGRVYAAARQPLPADDPRVTPLTLDVTSPEQIRAAAEQVGSLDVLVNNAGIARYDDLGDSEVLQEHFAVNVLGVLGVTQAFLPQLTRSGGAVVNNVSILAFAPLPLIASYSASKAAAFSVTQSLRSSLGTQGVSVHAVLTGTVDTDMTRGFDIPKASPESVAVGIFDGLEKDEEDIFPDEEAAVIADSWRNGTAKAYERERSGLARAARAAA